MKNSKTNAEDANATAPKDAKAKGPEQKDCHSAQDAKITEVKKVEPATPKKDK